jgi:hypothetical protein
MRKNRTKLRIVAIMLPAVRLYYFRLRTSKIVSTFLVARSLTLERLLHGPDFDIPFFQTIRWHDLVGQQLTIYFRTYQEKEVGINRKRNCTYVGTYLEGPVD